MKRTSASFFSSKLTVVTGKFERSYGRFVISERSAAMRSVSKSGSFRLAFASTNQKWIPSASRHEYQKESPLLIQVGATVRLYT